MKLLRISAPQLQMAAGKSGSLRRTTASTGWTQASNSPNSFALISEIPGDFKVRVGMMNPFSVLPILDDLVEAFDSDKIFKLLHLPIQSASHSVLKKMNRLHKMDSVDTIITKFRSRFEDISLFTDIIVGFCDETEDDFRETVEWVEKYRPEKVNISRYSPSPAHESFFLQKPRLPDFSAAFP